MSQNSGLTVACDLTTRLLLQELLHLRPAHVPQRCSREPCTLGALIKEAARAGRRGEAAHRGIGVADRGLLEDCATSVYITMHIKCVEP